MNEVSQDIQTGLLKGPIDRLDIRAYIAPNNFGVVLTHRNKDLLS